MHLVSRSIKTKQWLTIALGWIFIFLRETVSKYIFRYDGRAAS